MRVGRPLPIIAGGIERLDSVLSGAFKSRRIFVASWRDGRNFGDDYLSASMIRFLRRNVPKARIHATNLYLDRYRLNGRDVLIIAGGGLWGSDGSGYLAPELHSAWTRAEGSLVIANIGIESFVPPAASQLRELRERSALFSVRDEASWKIARGVLGNEAVIWTADTTFVSPLLVERRPEPHLVGVNVCGPEQTDFRQNFPIDRVVSAISGIVPMGYRIRAVVFNYGNRAADYKYCRLLDPTCGEGFTTTPYERCELFIGMHFHSVLMALQNAIPVIAISYADKVRRLMQEYGLDDNCLQPADPELAGKIVHLVSALDVKDIVRKIEEGNVRSYERIGRFEQELLRIP